MAMPVGLGVLGGALTGAANAYLEGLKAPSFEEIRAAREQKTRENEADIALKQAHALYYGRPQKGTGGVPDYLETTWGVYIKDPVTGKLKLEHMKPLDDADKTTEAQRLLDKKAAGTMTPAEEARLNMLLWGLAKPAPESGKMEMPWETDPNPSARLFPPRGAPAAAQTPPAVPPKPPPADATKQPPAEGASEPAAPGPSGTVKPPVTPPRKTGPAGAHEKRVETFTPQFDSMDVESLQETLKNLRERQKRNYHPITAAEIEAAERALARKMDKSVTGGPQAEAQPGGAPGTEQRPPVKGKPGITDKPVPTDKAFPKEVTPDPTWLQTYETLISNRPIEESDTHWDRLKLVKNMRPEVKAAYLEAYRKVHRKNPPGVVEGTLPSQGTGTGTATDAQTGTVATGGTQTAEVQPGAQQPAVPKPSDAISPKASPDYRRRATGEPVTSDERAAATRKLHGQGKVSGRVFTDLPAPDQDLVDAEVQRPKDEKEERDWQAQIKSEKDQRLAEEAAQDKKLEPARKAMAESMQKHLEELGKNALAGSKMERTFDQIEKLITSEDSVYGNTGEGNAAMLLYNSPFGKTGDQRARNTEQLRNLASQLQLAFGSLGSNVSVYDAMVYAKAQGNMQAAKDVPEMLQYMQIMRSVIRDVMWEHDYARAYVRKHGDMPPFGEAKTVTEAQVQQVMKEKGKTRDQVIEALRLKRMRVE